MEASITHIHHFNSFIEKEWKLEERLEEETWKKKHQRNKTMNLIRNLVISLHEKWRKCVDANDEYLEGFYFHLCFCFDTYIESDSGNKIPM